MTTVNKHSVIVKDRLIKHLSVAEVLVEISKVDPSLTGVFKIIKEGSIRGVSDYHDLDGVENEVGSNNDFYLVKSFEDECFEIVFGKEKLFKTIRNMLPKVEVVEYLNLSRDTDELENIVGSRQLERFTTLVGIVNKLEKVGFYSTDKDENDEVSSLETEGIENTRQATFIAETRDAEEIKNLLSINLDEVEPVRGLYVGIDEDNPNKITTVDPMSDSEKLEEEVLNLEEENLPNEGDTLTFDEVQNVYQQ